MQILVIMTVTLVLGHQDTVTMAASRFRTSDTVTDLLSDLGLSNVDITIPPRYLPVINIYIMFINTISFDDKGRVVYPDNLPIINNTHDLLLCFFMEAFFADTAFFDYLMTQAYDIWYDFYPHIHSLPSERSIYLYTPYHFVPYDYMDKEVFFNEWLTINSGNNITLNKVIVYSKDYLFSITGKYIDDVIVNKKEVYHTDVTYYPNGQIMIVNTYSTVNDEKFDYSHESRWVQDSVDGIEYYYLRHRYNFKDGKKHGLQESWYPNGQIGSRYNFNSNQKYDFAETWYPDEGPKSRYDFKGYELDGLQEEWYSNGQLKFRCMVQDGRITGLREQWYNDGQPMFRNNVKNGNLNGLQEAWYADRLPMYRLNFKDGRKHGLQEKWYASGQPKILEFCNNGKTDGIYESWFDDGEIKSRGTYDNGKLVGIYESHSYYRHVTYYKLDHAGKLIQVNP